MNISANKRKTQNNLRRKKKFWRYVQNVASNVASLCIWIDHNQCKHEEVNKMFTFYYLMFKFTNACQIKCQGDLCLCYYRYIVICENVNVVDGRPLCYTSARGSFYEFSQL